MYGNVEMFSLTLTFPDGSRRCWVGPKTTLAQIAAQFPEATDEWEQCGK